jgi:hypothetical protein
MDWQARPLEYQPNKTKRSTNARRHGRLPLLDDFQVSDILAALQGKQIGINYRRSTKPAPQAGRRSFVTEPE